VTEFLHRIELIAKIMLTALRLYSNYAMKSTFKTAFAFRKTLLLSL